MSPCRVTDNTLNVNSGVAPSIPGFGLSSAPIQLPFPNSTFPIDGVP